jgi:hypothetical protein
MPRGRPKKHVTEEDKAVARRERNRLYYIRKRKAQAPPEITFYAPTFPGAPTPTYPDLSLRNTADIRIPLDALVQPGELQEGKNLYRPASPLAPLALALSQLQAGDKKQTNERIEHEERLLQQIEGKDVGTTTMMVLMLSRRRTTSLMAKSLEFLAQVFDVTRFDVALRGPGLAADAFRLKDAE